MNITLLNNKVLVKKEEKQNHTDSGFLLPESSKEEKIQTGFVVAVGNGILNEKGQRMPLQVKVGDKVMYEYSSYATKEITLDKVEYSILDESAIIGILK